MRTTAVPAQVTTVEDRIAGNLGMGQIVLLFIPILFGSLLYAGLPPAMHSSAYKIVLLTVMLIVCVSLAIRIKGKIVLWWLVILTRYCARPRYYVFDKRSMHGRRVYTATTDTNDGEEMQAPEQALSATPMALADIIRLKESLERPTANLAFESRNGSLYVRITKGKPES